MKLNHRAQSRATNPSPKRQRGVQPPVACAPGSEKRRVVAHGRLAGSRCHTDHQLFRDSRSSDKLYVSGVCGMPLRGAAARGHGRWGK
jgi:hypothetical protein